jgi:DNA-binding HxlR family transcriptional regulator
VAEFRYEQFCPLARAAEILGERWTLLVLRELACGPQRYSDLRRRLPGVSSSVLSDRLARLEERGLVVRQEHPPPTPATLYALTEAGEAARPALHALMRFGVRFLDPAKAGEHLELDWMEVALTAFARTHALPKRSLAIRLDDGREQLRLRISSGRQGTRVERDDGLTDDAIRLAPLTLLGLLTRQLDPEQAAAAGAVEPGGLAHLRVLPDLFDLDDLIARPTPG